MRFRVLVLTAFALATLAPPASADADPLEIDILEGYLATQDKAPGMPHCARTHGYVFVPGAGPVAQAGSTNGLLEEHVEFHMQLGDGPASFKPTPDDADRYGEVFLEWHEYYVGLYQRWRADQGHPPLVGWNPATPMPASLAYPYPERACQDGRNSDPQVPWPTWATLEGGTEADPMFGHTRLCDFADLNQFGKVMGNGGTWHRAFHAGLGGETHALHGPRDPAFWAGHQFLIEVTRTYETECGRDASVAAAHVPATGEAGRVVPGSGAVAALAVLGAVAAWRRRG